MCWRKRTAREDAGHRDDGAVPRTTVRRTLEDLQALKLIRCAKGGAGTADGWQLRSRWRMPLRDLLQRLHKVPRPAQTTPTCGVMDRREAKPERLLRGVRRERA